MLYLASSVLMNNALISTAASIPGELGSQMSSGPPVVWTLGLRQTLIKNPRRALQRGKATARFWWLFLRFGKWMRISFVTAAFWSIISAQCSLVSGNVGKVNFHLRLAGKSHTSTYKDRAFEGKPCLEGLNPLGCKWAIVTNKWNGFPPQQNSEGGYDRFECRLGWRGHGIQQPPPTHSMHCTLEAFQQERCTDHVLIPSLQVNVQKDLLDTRLPSLGNCRPTSRCFMSETWSWGNHCLCSI